MNVHEIRERLETEAEPVGDADEALIFYDYLMERDESELAAVAINRAYGLRPDDEGINAVRQTLLDQLAVTDFGIKFRYVPAGPFLMGSDRGDRDEQPIHVVNTEAYWVSETPVTWAAYCDVLNWKPAPASAPNAYVEAEKEKRGHFYLHEMNKIRRQYCETETQQAADWHTHLSDDELADGERYREFFGHPVRDNANRPFHYNVKPMVAVGWAEALEMAEAMSKASNATYDLPTESEWEKAARGGLIQREYPWGDEPPTAARCDFDHPDEWKIGIPFKFPPNGYGIYAMAGGVWEWVRDRYDRLSYEEGASELPPEDADGQRVLRGGSWCDCGQAMRVAFRMGRHSNQWRDGAWGGHRSPTIGFRLCRRASLADDS